MVLEEAIQKLRELNEPVPRPGRLPSEQEVDAAEKQLGIRFPSSLRTYLLQASDVNYGFLEPVTLTTPGAHTQLQETATDAWSVGVPRDHVPICHDNGDYYCVRPDGKVVFWSHNGVTDESWPDVGTWILEVWIGGA